MALGLAFAVRDVVMLAVSGLLMLLVLLPAVIGGFFWRKATSGAAFWSILFGFVVNIVLTPLMPATAFLPAFLVSAVIFVVGSLISRHSPTENTELQSDVREA